MPSKLAKSTTNVFEPGQQVVVDFTYANPVVRSGHYLLFIPANFSPAKRYPTIFFLHGSGERGSDPELLKRHGLPKIVARRSDFPFIVIAPQCPTRQRWPLALLDGLFAAVSERYPLDPQRLYLTGLSIGGYATWKWALAHPHRFAAIAPICGWSEPQAAPKIAHLPVWAFHGALDEVVPVDESLKMVAALRAAGGRPRLTIYARAHHDAWTRTYSQPWLYHWFLQHRNIRKGDER